MDETRNTYKAVNINDSGFAILGNIYGHVTLIAQSRPVTKLYVRNSIGWRRPPGIERLTPRPRYSREGEPPLIGALRREFERLSLGAETDRSMSPCDDAHRITIRQDHNVRAEHIRNLQSLTKYTERLPRRLQAHSTSFSGPSTDPEGLRLQQRLIWSVRACFACAIVSESSGISESIGLDNLFGYLPDITLSLMGQVPQKAMHSISRVIADVQTLTLTPALCAFLRLLELLVTDMWHEHWQFLRPVAEWLSISISRQLGHHHPFVQLLSPYFESVIQHKHLNLSWEFLIDEYEQSAKEIELIGTVSCHEMRLRTLEVIGNAS